MKKYSKTLCLLICMSSTQVFAEETEWLESLGDIGRYGIPIAALFSTLVKQDWQGLPQLGLSLSSSLAVNTFLKETVNEERPRDKTSTSSFPSGHATWAFASAGYIERRYGVAPGIVAYSFASLVAYSRVRVQAHHTHDVLIGALLGIGASYIFTSPQNPNTLSIEASPFVTRGSQGLQLQLRF